MAQITPIEWTDASSNLTRYRDRETGRDVWACVKTSPGCAHCYSEAKAHWLKRGHKFTRPNIELVEPYFSEKEAASVLRSKKLSGKRLFIDDMTDGFGDWVPFDLIDRRFALFAVRHDVTFQVLTKWPERMLEYLGDLARRVREWDADEGETEEFLVTSAHDGEASSPQMTAACSAWLEKFNARNLGWPLPNVWLGTSVENADYYSRIHELRKIPAAIRFLSLEPLLGPLHDLPLDGIDWVIVGGESGHNARPMHPDWARSIRDQCQAAGVPFFFKQWGEFLPLSQAEQMDGFDLDINWAYNLGDNDDAARVGKKTAGRLLDGREWSEFPSN